MLVASGSDVMRMSTDYVGGMINDVILSMLSGDDVTAMTYDSSERKLYVGVMSNDAAGGHYIAEIDLRQQPASR